MDASGSEHARASESVDAILSGGDEVTLGLNPQYLIEALGAVKSEFVRVTFTSSDTPTSSARCSSRARLRSIRAGLDSFKYLLQPNLLLR